MKRLAAFIVLAGLMLTAGCGESGSGPSEEDGVLDVFVSIPPQEYLARRVGGQRVRVESVLGQGQSPHHFEPTGPQITRLGEADVYFTAGLPFEETFVPRVRKALGTLHTVDCTAGIERRSMGESHEHEPHGHAHHDHAEEDHDAHHHDHTGADPHVWLAPMNGLSMARQMRDELVRLDPDGAEEYEANFQDLKADLEDLDQSIRQMLEPYHGWTMFVFHPAYGYFTDAYGLRQQSVEVEGKPATGEALVALAEQARQKAIPVLFTQAEFSERGAQAVAKALGIRKTVVLDPLAKDYIENLRRMAETLAGTFENESPATVGKPSENR